MSKKIAIVLSGCGHKDGAEITEAAATLIALAEAGATYQIFAPDQEFEVKDPITAKPTGEKRNVMLEAARIARGDIRGLAGLRAADFDALTFPGGFGAASVLSSWSSKGADCVVHPEVVRVINEFYSDEKPIAAVCIAPTLVAKVLGSKGVTVTLGDDPEVAAEIAKTGAHHSDCAVDDYVTDRDHRIVTSPAYMYDQASAFEVFTGVRKAMRELVEMA